VTDQYGSFDGLDNRREIMRLLKRLGHGLPELAQAERRSRFLRKLLRYSQNGFDTRQMQLAPCSVVDAYFAFLAITGTLGVPIDQAARLLEKEVSG
jgi:hypothetical protein